MRVHVACFLGKSGSYRAQNCCRCASSNLPRASAAAPVVDSRAAPTWCRQLHPSCPTQALQCVWVPSVCTCRVSACFTAQIAGTYSFPLVHADPLALDGVLLNLSCAALGESGPCAQNGTLPGVATPWIRGGGGKTAKAVMLVLYLGIPRPYFRCWSSSKSFQTPCAAKKMNQPWCFPMVPNTPQTS